MNPFNWSWPARIWSVLGLLFVASVLYPIFGRSQDNHGYRNPAGICQRNLKQIGLGLLQYTQDYDEKFPPAAPSGPAYGWANAIQPYIRSTQLFHCPEERNAGQTDFKLSGYTDYFFNAQLQKREMTTIGISSQIIMVAEGNDGAENTDARYAKTAIPAGWRTDSNSPSFRHLGTANYLFADGHVKAYKVGEIATNWSRDKPFFQPEQ